MKLLAYIGERASLKLIGFLIVFIFIFLENKNQAIEDFNNKNLKHLIKKRSEARALFSHLDIISSVGNHLYMDHGKSMDDQMFSELNSVRLDEGKDIVVGLMEKDKTGKVTINRIPDFNDPRMRDKTLEKEVRIAYSMLRYGKEISYAVEDQVWLYYMTRSGIISEYPDRNWEDGSEIQSFFDASFNRYSKDMKEGLSILYANGKNDMIIKFAKGVYHKKELKGIISGSLNVDLQIPDNMDIYIFDKEMNMIFQKTNKNPDEEFYRKLIESKTTDKKVIRMGYSYVLAYPAKVYDGMIFYTIPLRVVYYHAFKENMILLLIALIFFMSQYDTNRRKRIMDERERLISQLKVAKRNLEATSELDYLTSILNRRGFLKRADQEYSRFKRSGKQFSIILGDIDYFKRFNDENGHECGDEVLKTVSRILKKNIRQTDLLARWGGEEFILILVESRGDESYKRMEKIRMKIEEKSFTYMGKELHLTMTFGISEVNSVMSIEKSIGIADQAMYRGKRNGRNRVETAKEGREYSLL